MTRLLVYRAAPAELLAAAAERVGAEPLALTARAAPRLASAGEVIGLEPSRRVLAALLAAPRPRLWLDGGAQDAARAELARVLARRPPPPDLGLELAPAGCANAYDHLTPLADPPPCTVVIPTYDRVPHLEKTLAALSHARYEPGFEVIIADDGSSEDIEAAVRRFRPRLDVRVVRQDRAGFRLAAARNLGARAARHEVVVFLDNDLLLHPDALRALVRWCLPGVLATGERRFVDAAGLSAAELERDPELLERLPEVSGLDPAEARRRGWRERLFDVTAELRSAPMPWLGLLGGWCGLRRSDLERLGGFDEAFDRWGGEDTELAHRAVSAGFYLRPVRDAMALHQEHPAPARTPDRLSPTYRARVPAERLVADAAAAVPALLVAGDAGAAWLADRRSAAPELWRAGKAAGVPSHSAAVVLATAGLGRHPWLLGELWSLLRRPAVLELLYAVDARGELLALAVSARAWARAGWPAGATWRDVGPALEAHAVAALAVLGDGPAPATIRSEGLELPPPGLRLRLSRSPVERFARGL